MTASKLLVKSATENERQLLECLGHCVTLIDRIGTVTNDVALYTITPQQTLALLVKVRDVAETYLITVKAAGQVLLDNSNISYQGGMYMAQKQSKSSSTALVLDYFELS